MVSGGSWKLLVLLLAVVVVNVCGEIVAQEDDSATVGKDSTSPTTTIYGVDSTELFTEGEPEAVSETSTSSYTDEGTSTVPSTSTEGIQSKCPEIVQPNDAESWLNISVSYPSNNQAHIRWNITDPELEDCLQIINVSTSPELQQQWQDDDSVILSDLEVCTKYDVIFTWKIKDGQTFEVIDKVLNYGRFDIGLNVIGGMLRWSYPAEGLRCCKSFEVKQEIPYKNITDVAFVDVSSDRELSYGLIAASEECWTRVVTITPIHASNVRGYSIRNTSRLVEIGEVENVSTVDDGEGTVNISWVPPNAHKECMKSYKVTILDLVSYPPADDTSYQLRGQACRTYEVNIEIVDVEGELISVALRNVTMAEQAIGAVHELQLVESKSGEVQVKWKLPTVSQYCVSEYIVEEVLHTGESPVPYTDSENLITLKVADVCSLSSVKVTPASKSNFRGNVSELNLLYAVQNLRAEQQTITSVKLSWNPPQILPSCVTHYLVFREGLPKDIGNISSSEIIIGDLKTCHSYTFIVVAVNSYMLEYPLSEVTVVPEEHISAVRNVVQEHNWVEWKFPANGAGCIQQFIFTQMTAAKDEFLFNSTLDVGAMSLSKTTPTIFRQLRGPVDPCAVQIKTIIIPVSVGGIVGDKFEIVLPPPTISPVNGVTLVNDVERQITVKWRKPTDNPECVETYRVSYLDQVLNISNTETSVTIERLLACVEYNFTVTAVSYTGAEAEGVTASAVVLEEPISEVVDLEMKELEFRSLTAQWKPPEIGTHCVANYRVQAWVVINESIVMQFSDTVPDMHVTFGEVYACAPYSVQVIPVSFSEKDGINNIAEIWTLERVLQRAHIESPVPTQRLAHSLELRTNLVNTTYNLCQLTMVRFTCRSDRVAENEAEVVIKGESPISDPEATYSAVVEPLTPYTEYNCTARVQNIAGWSEETSPVSVTTEEDFPGQPRDLQLGQGKRSIALNWNAPLVRNGVITRYRIHIRSVGARYPTPSYCPLDPALNLTIDLPNGDEESLRTTNWNEDELQHTIRELMPYTDYIVQVAAATKAGLGPYTELVLSSTLPEVSEPVYEFEEYNVTLPEVDQPYNTSVYFSWKLPCRLNGRLRGFMGQFTGVGNSMEFHSDWEKHIEPNEEIQEKYTFLDHRLEPETVYNVSLMVFVNDVDAHSEAKFLEFRSPAGIPDFKEGVSWGTVNVLDAPNPTNTARISLSNIIFESPVGSIRYIALLLSERHCQDDPELQRNLSNEWPDERSWHEVNRLPCVPQYQTTPEHWNPAAERRRTGRSNESIHYVIGSEACTEAEGYCNGPLKPGTEYVLIVRIFTDSGYTDSPYQYFQTDSLIQLMLIVCTIFGCLLLAFVLGLVVFWRSQKALAVQLATTRSPNEEPSDIPLKSFSGIYEELIQSNKEKITKEYQAINYFSEQLVNETVTFFVAKENERKNRYLGILPYDGNRVPLDHDDAIGDEDEEVNDYINASFIDGYKYQREYIATQGPKKETSFDFWRMILQYDVESIVMLTQTVENDRIKCYQYFPRFKETMAFRDIVVKCTQEMKLTFYQKRLITVTRGNQTKTVFHYHFLVWPDHGCPTSPADLIKLIKIIRTERKNLALPVVVHCSAGVGRTGTFIALDIILQRIQQEKKINIYDTVKQLRRQRVKMVQTGEQYAFLYQSCLEYTNRSARKKPKTSSDDNSNDSRSSQITRNGISGSGRKPLVNIKFPKYVHSGISNVKSYVPDDTESQT